MAAPLTTNIASHLSVMAECQPWRAAVVFPQGRDQQGRVSYTHYTYLQLDEVSNRLARGFQGIGIRRGTRVALMVPPSLDFFALTFALFKMGAVPVLIDPGMGLRHLGRCLAEAGPEAFIGIPKAHAARVILGWGRKTVAIKVTVGEHALTGGYTLKQVAQRGTAGAGEMSICPEPGETAAILFTSGSTGPAKGVVYTHEIFTAQVEQIRALYGIEPGEIDLPTFPLFALFGPALGMTAILPDMDPTLPAQVDAAKIVEAIENFGVTNMFGSPALIGRVGRYGESRGVKLATIRRAISAGAPVPAKALERFVSILPPGAQVFTPYGATECLPVASIGSDEILKETRFQTDWGKGVCVGKPVPGLTVRIIRIADEPISAWNDSLFEKPGEIGEIVVQAPHATASYFNRPEATALAKIPDPMSGGFYHRMGDVGYLDERGRIWFCGRKSQRVVTARGVHFTIPCEAVFNAHPGIYRTALVGVRRGNEMEPVICVEMEEGARGVGLEKLRSQLRDRGAKQPHTQAIKTFLLHPGFPVDIRHNAKIFREKLAVWASRQMGG
jgi:olefin beta-lactone synthetase